MAGLHLDIETVAWWRRQSGAARVAVTEHAAPIDVVLAEFAAWFSALKPVARRSESEVLVWSNGPAFDQAVIENAYLAVGLTCPTYYRNVRCCRTLWALARELVDWEKPKREVAHRALADAIAQAEDLRDAMRTLRAGIIRDASQGLPVPALPHSFEVRATPV